MSNTVIKVENLSKQYRLGLVGSTTLGDDIKRWWASARGKEDPFLKIGESNDRSKKGESDYVWSLRDINFEVQQGDTLGIIGRNGAGKSTLLKILSKVTAPTTGNVKVKGRIASLLEVGTGFHPELTGRENIYLNGAILGMRKHEIKRKFDEIVDFSGVERYIDTPVKRYSSGMYVRLAFAVAAHLESEILIVDEVLAVGDAEFQKKCLGKMGEVSKGEGRTVLFVSHNMAAVKSLCNQGVLLKNGETYFSGGINQIVDKYLSMNMPIDIGFKYEKKVVEKKDIQLVTAKLINNIGNSIGTFEISEEINVELVINCTKLIPNIYGYIVVKNNQDEVFIESDTKDFSPNILNDLKIGLNKYRLRISNNILSIGDYTIYLSFASRFSDNFNVEISGNILNFNVIDSLTERGNSRKAYTSFLINWEKIC